MLTLSRMFDSRLLVGLRGPRVSPRQISRGYQAVVRGGIAHSYRYSNAHAQTQTPGTQGEEGSTCTFMEEDLFFFLIFLLFHASRVFYSF